MTESPIINTKSIPETPKVSVCIVTYKQEGYIRQCIESIIDQKTNFEFEIIVGNDCSPDGTDKILAEIANAHPNKVRVVSHAKTTSQFTI
jgi:glycosyltransferase involved in cell wall biosynthesis